MYISPMELGSQGFGDIICLVAGQYGEISQGGHGLIHARGHFEAYVSGRRLHEPGSLRP